MSKHEELIERLEALAEEAHAYHDGSDFDIQAKAAFRAALEAQAREIADMQQQESELCTLHAMAEAECKRLRAEIEALRKDAERYRTFIDCGQPICFMGEEYFGKDALDTAIDAAKGAPND